MLLVVSLCVTLVALSTADDCNVGGTDVWWGDIYNWYAPNFQACKDRCRTDGRCRGVVYYHWGFMEGKCFLKNGNHGYRIGCAWCTAAFEPCISKEGPCSAGQYKSSRLVCSSCPANSYSSAGSSSCNKCPVGHFSGVGASSCSRCPAGTFNGEQGGSCKPCPADTFNDQSGAAQCNPCGEGYVSAEGSYSADSCQLLNGEHCWELYDNVRLTGMYGDAMTYEEANPACFADANCTGVTCRRWMRKDDECYLASGEEHQEEKKKWYISLKEC